MSHGLLRGFSNPAAVTGSSTKRKFSFAEIADRPIKGLQAPVFFSNNHTVAAYVLINENTDAAIAPGGYHVIVPPGTTKELTEGGRVPISVVDAIWASDPGDISVTGWNWPGGNGFEDDREDNAAVADVRTVKNEPIVWTATDAGIVPGVSDGRFSGSGGSGVNPITQTGQFCNILEITNDYDEPAYVRLNVASALAGEGLAGFWDTVGSSGHDWIIPAGETVEVCVGLLMVRSCSIWLPSGALGDVNIVGYNSGRWQRRH